jgi:hypothetical protein
VSLLGVKVSLTVGQGVKALHFDLYECKAIDKKTELQNILFRLAEKSTDLECKLEKAHNTIHNLKAQKGGGAGTSAGIFDLGDGKKKKNQPKTAPKQAGMSAINPGSKKRKAARGVQLYRSI